jgi:hypothetical protein
MARDLGLSSWGWSNAGPPLTPGQRRRRCRLDLRTAILATLEIGPGSDQLLSVVLTDCCRVVVVHRVDARTAYASLASSRMSSSVAQRNASVSSLVVSCPPVILQRKTGDDPALHVLVDPGEADGLDVQAGLLADFAAEPIVDGLA